MTDPYRDSHWWYGNYPGQDRREEMRRPQNQSPAPSRSPSLTSRRPSLFDFEGDSYQRRPSLFDFEGDSYPGAGSPPPPQNFPSLPGAGGGIPDDFFGDPNDHYPNNELGQGPGYWRARYGDDWRKFQSGDDDDDDDDDDPFIFSGGGGGGGGGGGRDDAPTGGVNDLGDPLDPYPTREQSGPDWSGWFETPDGMRAYWQNLVSQGGHRRGKAQRLHAMFEEIQGKFIGQLVQDILGGGAPNRKFTNFAEALNLDRLFADLTPAQKGRFGGRYGRPTRHLYHQQ